MLMALLNNMYAKELFWKHDKTTFGLISGASRY